MVFRRELTHLDEKDAAYIWRLQELHHLFDVFLEHPLDVHVVLADVSHHLRIKSASMAEDETRLGR